MSDQEHHQITREEIRELAHETSRETVEEVFRRLGLDVDDPRAMQQDLAYIRKSREGAEEVQRWAKRGAVGVVTSGFLWALWEGLKAMAHRGGAP